MSGLLGYLPFFKDEQRPLPETVETDDVIPVHLFDDSSAARGIVLVWTFKFDDVLDPDKLHTALSELFQMEGWRRFSGRFRYRVGQRHAHTSRNLLCDFGSPLIQGPDGRELRHTCPERMFEGASGRVFHD